MGVPVVFLGQGFVNAVIEVFVVRENDMTTDIVQLTRRLANQLSGCHSSSTHKAFFGHICRGQTARSLIGVYDQP